MWWHPIAFIAFCLAVGWLRRARRRRAARKRAMEFHSYISPVTTEYAKMDAEVTAEFYRLEGPFTKD